MFCFIHRFDAWILKFNAVIMGNSTSTGFAASTPKKLSWGCQKEDTVKLEDFLTKNEEDLWSIKRKQSLSVKKIHLPQKINYVDLEFQKSGNFYPNSGEYINHAFVEDNGP